MSEAPVREAPSIPFEDLPDRLKRSRERTGMHQSQIGAILGVHQRTIANYEGGNTEPKIDTLKQWARITNVPLDWLVFGMGACVCPDCQTHNGPEASDRRTCFSMSDQASSAETPAEASKRPELVLIKS